MLTHLLRKNVMLELFLVLHRKTSDANSDNFRLDCEIPD